MLQLLSKTEIEKTLDVLLSYYSSKHDKTIIDLMQKGKRLYNDFDYQNFFNRLYLIYERKKCC